MREKICEVYRLCLRPVPADGEEWTDLGKPETRFRLKQSRVITWVVRPSFAQASFQVILTNFTLIMPLYLDL